MTAYYCSVCEQSFAQVEEIEQHLIHYHDILRTHYDVGGRISTGMRLT